MLFAAWTLSKTPPICPTVPFELIVPVTVKLELSCLCSSPAIARSVIARPALGPDTLESLLCITYVKSYLLELIDRYDDAYVTAVCADWTVSCATLPVPPEDMLTVPFPFVTLRYMLVSTPRSMFSRTAGAEI